MLEEKQQPNELLKLSHGDRKYKGNLYIWSSIFTTNQKGGQVLEYL